MSLPTIFIDRDGTLVEARHYPSRPEDLLLYDGIGDELRHLQEHGFLLVVITNQSGIARGYFDETDLERMHDHLRNELSRFGVTLDGIYFCPHHIEGVIPHLSVACDCRKPSPGMLLRAAADLDIDLGRSWFIGDILDDVEAGNRAGCRTILVDLGTEPLPSSPIRQPDYIGRDALHALWMIQMLEVIGPDTWLEYQPPNWQRPALYASHDSRDWMEVSYGERD